MPPAPVPPPTPQVLQFVQAVQASAAQVGFNSFLVAVRDNLGVVRIFGKNHLELKPAVAEQLGFEDAAEAEWPRHG